MQVRAVDIKVGYSCNNNCIHCVIAGHRERLLSEKKPLDRGTAEVKKLFLDAGKKSAESITITGGEPTIRKDFFELLEFASGLGLKVNIQTNGRAFSMPFFADKTLSVSPNAHFVIALHNTKRGVHDAITRAKGSWKQTVGGIRNLKKGGGSVSLKVVLSRLNYKDLPALVLLAEKIGVKEMPVAFPHGMGNALKYWREVIPTYSEIEPWVNRAVKVAEERGVFLSYEAVPFCFLKGCERHASEIKYLQDWLDDKTTELRQVGDPLMDWQKKRLSSKRKAESCKSCRYFNVCEGAWAEYFGFYGLGEFKPVYGKRIETMAEFWDAIKS